MKRFLLAVIVLLGLYSSALSQQWDIIGVRMEPYRSDWISVPGIIKISSTKALIRIADNEAIQFRLDSFYEEEGCIKYNVTTLLEDSYNAAYITVCDDYIYLIEYGYIVMYKVSKVKKL